MLCAEITYYKITIIFFSIPLKDPINIFPVYTTSNMTYLSVPQTFIVV